MKRKSIPLSTRMALLHESGFCCSNPNCRTLITLDLHHIDYVSNGGSDEPINLIALCPNCHSRHHSGIIPEDSIRTWKMLLLSLNEGHNKSSIDILLALDQLKEIRVQGEGILKLANLIASNYVQINPNVDTIISGLKHKTIESNYLVKLTDKGQTFVKGWKEGKQDVAIGAI